MKPQITIRHMPASQALEDYIVEHATRLSKVHAGIVACRVTVESPPHHHRQGGHFTATLDISVPGRDVIVNHDHHEDPYVALRDAFAAARRQLEERSQRRRGDVKHHGRGPAIRAEDEVDRE